MRSRMFRCAANVAFCSLGGLILTCMLTACISQRPVDDIRVSADDYAFRGDYRSAADEYELITLRYPGDWQAQSKLGMCLLEMDRLSGARRALMLANEQRPSNPAITDSLAEVMFRQGDERGLHVFLRRQIDMNGTVRDHRRLARYAMAMEDLDTAKVAMETAIVLDEGGSVGPYMDSAAFAQRVGDLDMAIRRLRQAYGINPRDTQVNEQLIALGEIPGPTIALPPGR